MASISGMRDRWTDILIHFNSSAGGNMEIYLNGSRRVSTANFIRFRPQSYYVKYGIYRSFVSRHGGPMPTQVVYYDEVRLANTREAADIN